MKPVEQGFTLPAAIALLAHRDAVVFDMVLQERGQQFPLLDAHESLV